MYKGLLKLFSPVAALGVAAFVFAGTAHATGYPGSITVCKIIADSNGNIVDGSANPGVGFSISGLNTTTSQGGPAGVIGTSNFTTPLSLNSKILASSAGNDAQCIKYDNLALGNYYWGEESVSGSSFGAPSYNDQFTTPVVTLSDFFGYDNKLFDGDPANDASRNTNADGHIVLESNRPNRTLVVLNRQNAAPQGGISTTVSTGGGTSEPGKPSCPSKGPQAVEKIWFSDVSANKVTVHWDNKGDAFGYHIAYGPLADKLIWGVEVGNVSQVTLSDLPGGELWVSVSAKANADCGGPTTGPVKVSGGEVLGASILGATGFAQSTFLFALGLVSIFAGLWQTQKRFAKSK